MEQRAMEHRASDRSRSKGSWFRPGKAVGLGFVPVIAMAELIEEVDQLGCRGKVMTKQPDTAQYRSAMVEVVI